MRPHIAVRLLGATRLDFASVTRQHITTRLQPLIAYLLLCCRELQTRQAIAADLFADMPRGDALLALDGLMAQLQDTFSSQDHFLHIDGNMVQCRLPATMLVDVDAFDDAVARADRSADADTIRIALEEAVALYGGEFLPAAQNPWVQAERERLHHHYVEVLERIVHLFEERHDYYACLPYARRLLELDAIHEPRYRRLVNLYVLHGERVSAWTSLVRRLQAAIQQQGALILIGGEPGVGKTTLAQTFGEMAQAQKAIFALGRSYEQGTAPPFGPWQELLAHLRREASAETERLPEPFGTAPPAASDHQLQQTLLDFLIRLSQQQPLVLLLDDLQWADQDSLQILDFVTRGIERLPLLVIGTYRSDAIQLGRALHGFLPALQRNRSVEHVRLTPLSMPDTERLVEAQLGPSTPDLIRYLFSRSDGNALFLVELLQDLKDRGLLTRDQLGRWNPPAENTPVPVMLQQLIEQRAARLGAQAQEFLNVASVVGDRWRLDIVEKLLDWPEESFLNVLEAIESAGIAEVDDVTTETYRFSHGLIREALYGRQLVRRRRRLHGQVFLLLKEAQLTNPDLEPAFIAYHAYQAARWDMVLRYGLAAGEAARRRYAHHGALQFYRQAQEATDRAPSVAGPEVRIRLAEQLGEIHMALNNKQESESAFEKMLVLARSLKDKNAESRALSHLSNAYAWLYRFDDAARTGEAALRLAEETGDRYALALNHYNLGHLYLVDGELTQAAPHLRRAQEIADQPALQARTLQNLSYTAIFTGDYEEARTLADDAVRLARTSRDGLAMTGACYAAALIQIEQGDYAQASATIREGLALAEESGKHHYTTKLLNTMGYLYNELGDYAAARTWNQQALETSRREGENRNREAEYYALLNLATDELYAGQLAQAQIYRREFEAILDNAEYSRYRWINRYHLLCTELALAEGDYKAALDGADEALRHAENPSVPKNICKSKLFAGQALLALGQVNEACAELQTALAIADRIAHGSLRWKMRLRLAQAYAQQNRSNAHLLREALDQVEAAAVRLQDPALASTFLASPLVLELKANARSPIRAERAAPPEEMVSADEFPAGLTAREVEVLQLIAQGATNRQIGKQLHISVKTVNTHVTNILNKTGCENRVLATAFALQNDLVT